MDSPRNMVNASFTSYSPRERGDRSEITKLNSLSASPYKIFNPHGVEKFHITQIRKNAHKDVELISNRINQLIKSEEKARKKIDVAQKKAELIQRAKERREVEVKEKEILKEIRKIEEEEQRKKNREEKERRLENTKNYQNVILNEKKNIVEATKKKSEQIDAMCKEYKMMVVNQKNEKKSMRYSQVLEHKQRVGIDTNTYNVNLKEEYERRIAEEKNAHLELINKKKELEKYEAELINKLANTEQNQVLALKNLETLAKVSLFHLGLRP